MNVRAEGIFTMGYARKEQLARHITLALTTGLFSIVPVVAEGAPVLDQVVTPEADVVKSGTVTDVTSTVQNNIVKWEDFSVAKGETVRFDNGAQTNNYLNIVTGTKQSDINGTITGGKDVYIVNPHGVLIDENATVNVGNLYVSTAPPSALNTANFEAGGSPLDNTANKAAGAVTNLGKIAATSVSVEGTDIKFMDTADVTATAVDLNATQNIRLGQRASTAKGKYALPSGYTTNVTPSYFGTIKNQADLSAISSKLNGDYEVANDISLSGNLTPIGENSPFTGTFDGNYHTISNLNNSGYAYGGLFGKTSGATIQNVGVKVGTISATTAAGGIVGYANKTNLKNVFNTGATTLKVSKGGDPMYKVGGIVGYSVGSTIEQAYNNATVGGRGAGIVGTYNSTTIKNVYNTSASPYGIVTRGDKGDTTSSIISAYTTNSNKYYMEAPKTTTGVIQTASSKNMSTYVAQGFDISDDGEGKNKDGNPTVWRIYEGYSMPLLRDLLRRGKGTVSVNYDYTHGNTSGSISGQDLDVTYNAQDLTIGTATYTLADGTAVTSGITRASTKTFHDANVYSNDTSYNSQTGQGVADTKNGELLFYSTAQTGYDLVGDKVFVRQRQVNVQNALQNSTIAKEYDGTNVLTAADIKKLIAGSSSSSSGLIPNDTTAELDAGNLTATFDDEKVGASKIVTLNGGLSLKNLNGHHNYKITGGSTTFNNVQRPGEINPRQLIVDLTQSTGSISKTYDGSAKVNTANYTLPVSAFQFQQVAATSTNDTDNKVLDANGKSEDVYLGLKSGQDSYYGSGTTAATFQSNADAGTKSVQYNGIFLDGTQAGNYVLLDTNGNVVYGKLKASDPSITNPKGGTIYGAGKIDPRVIDTSVFTVKDANGNTAAPTKVYDGSSAYTLPSGSTLVQGTSTIADSGVLPNENIKFAINSGNSYFTDASGNATSQVAAAKGAAIGITATAGTGTKLSNYVWGTPTSTGATTATTGSLLSVQPTTNIKTTGTIKPRAITVAVTQPKTTIITKNYNGNTDVDYQKYPGANTFGSAGYVNYATGSLQLADGTNGTTKDGTSFKVTAAYDSEDVNRANGNPQGAVLNRNIDYTIAIDGANAANYTLNGTQLTSSAKSVKILGTQSGAQGLINPKSLSSTLKGPDKTYDGTTNLPSNFSMTKTLTSNDGLIGSDSVTLSIGSAAYHTKDANYQSDGTTPVMINGVARQNWVDYQNLTLTGQDAGNYDIASTMQGSGIIRQKALGANDFTYTFGTLTKEYDGTTTITSTDAQAGLTGVTVKSTGDVFKGMRGTQAVDFTKNSASATYTSANSNNQTAQDVNYTVTLFDDGSGNYVMPTGGITKNVTATGAGVIKPRVIEAHIVDSDLTKTYDADTAATANTSKGNQYLIRYTYAGTNRNATAALVGGDTDASTGLYVTKGTTTADADASAVKGKDVIYTLKTSAKDPSNYMIVDSKKNVISTLTGDGTINKRDLKVTFNNVSKAYDGTGTVSDANLTGALQLDDGASNAVITKDGLLTDFNTTGTAANAITGTYQDASSQYNVGSYAVNYTNVLAALGTHAKNYNISTLSSKANGGTIASTGDITKLTLGKNFIFDFNTISKEYDGNNQVAHTDAGGTYHSRESYIGNHYVDMNGNGTYDAGDIQLSGITASKAEYNSPNSNNGTSQAVNYDLSFGNLGNYNIANGASWTHGGTTLTYNNNAFTATTTGTITPRKVVGTVNNTNITKTYDATTTVNKGKAPFISYTHYAPNGTPVGTGLVGSDADATTAVYKDPNGVTANDADASALQGKDVLYTLAITSADPSNYEFVDATGVAQPTITQAGGGTIDKRNLTINFGKTAKSWDGSDVATGNITAVNATLSDANNSDGKTGIFNTDGTGKVFQSNLSKIAGQYLDAKGQSQSNADKNLTVKYSNLAIAFVDAQNKDYGRNYAFSATATGTGDIDPLAINSKNFHLDFSGITKEYDATDAVVGTGGTSSYGSGDYVTRNWIDVDNDGQLTNKDVVLGGGTTNGATAGFQKLIQSATYDSNPRGNVGSNQGVTYVLNLGNPRNYTFGTGFTNVQTGTNTKSSYANGRLTAQTTGDITKRKVVAAATNTNPTKTYDAGSALVNSKQYPLTTPLISYTHYGTAGTGLVGSDKDASTGKYTSVGAGTGRKKVQYNLAINNGSNYEIVDSTGKAISTLDGAGTINKAPLTIDFGNVWKVYDGKADVTTSSPAQYSGTTAPSATPQTAITPTLSGFVGGENAAFDAAATAKISGSYVKWDSSTKTWVVDPHVNWADINTQTLGYKAVGYSGIDTAFADLVSRNSVLANYELTGATTQGASVTANANGIAQSVYFSEALQKGQILPLALIMGNIQANTTTTTKEYDGTDAVQNPTKTLTLYETMTGNNIVIPYTLQSATYDNGQVDQTNGAKVGVTYALDTKNPFPAMTLNDFVINAATQQAYQGKTFLGDGIITPKEIYVQLDTTKDITKAYDSTKTASKNHVKYYDSSNKQVAAADIIAQRDKGKVSIDVTSALFDDENASIDRATSALKNARTITYTVDLDDTTNKGNYVLLRTNAQTAGMPTPVMVTNPTTGMTTTLSRTENTYTATGDIYRAAIKVRSDAKTSTEGTTPSGYTGKTTGWYSDADHAAYQAGGGDANITWNIKPGQDATRRGTYGIYGWYLGQKFPVQQVSQTTDPTTGAVLTTTETITNPVTNTVITRVTDAKTKVTTYQDANGKTLPASAVIGWFDFSNNPAQTSDPDWASSGLASYYLVGSDNNGLFGTNYYFEQDPSDLTVTAQSHGGGGGGTVKPVTPVTPVNPVTPVTPDNPVTPVTPDNPVTPVTPVLPTTTPDISSDVNAAKQFVPNTDAYNNVSHDDFGSVTRSGQAGIEYASGGINVAGAETPTVSTSDVDNAAIGLQNAGSIVNLSGGDAMEVSASRIDLTGGDSFTVTVDDGTTYDSSAAVETTGAQTKDGTVAVDATGLDATGAQTKDGAAAVDTTALDTTAAIETAGTDATTAETPTEVQDVLSESVPLSTDDTEARDAQAEVRSADADVMTETTQQLLTTEETELFGDETSATEQTSQTQSSSEARETSLFANAIEEDETATPSALSTQTAEDTASSEDAEETDDEESREADSSEAADDSAIGIESEGAGVKVA